MAKRLCAWRGAYFGLGTRQRLIRHRLRPSEKLAEHWDALDEFEGIQYRRVRVQGTLESGERVDAWTYEMKEAQIQCS